MPWKSIQKKLGAQALTNLAVSVGKSYVGDAAGGLGSAALDLVVRLVSGCHTPVVWKVVLTMVV
jgi:hypothetical protein